MKFVIYKITNLINGKLYIGQTRNELKKRWLEKVSALVASFNLTLTIVDENKVPYGGRKGFHSEYLQPLLSEMTEVTQLDPKAEW